MSKTTITTDTGEAVTCLSAQSDMISRHHDGTWIVRVFGSLDRSVIFVHVAHELHNLYLRHAETTPLLVQTDHDTRRVYPARAWPVLTVRRSDQA